MVFTRMVLKALGQAWSVEWLLEIEQRDNCYHIVWNTFGEKSMGMPYGPALSMLFLKLDILKKINKFFVHEHAPAIMRISN